MKHFDNRILEQYIKVDTSYRLRRRRLLVYGAIAVGGGLIFAVDLFLAMRIEILQGTPLVFSLFAVVLALLFTKRFTKRQFVEFEYSFCNGLMEFAKITNKEKRKDQPGFDCDGVTSMSHKYDPTRGDGAKNFANIYDYTSNEEGDNIWFFIVDRAEGGRSLFILEPNETILAALREYVPKAAIEV